MGMLGCVSERPEEARLHVRQGSGLASALPRGWDGVERAVPGCRHLWALLLKETSPLVQSSWDLSHP